MNEIIEDVIDILNDYKMYLVAPRKDMLLWVVLSMNHHQILMITKLEKTNGQGFGRQVQVL